MRTNLSPLQFFGLIATASVLASGVYANAAQAGTTASTTETNGVSASPAPVASSSASETGTRTLVDGTRTAVERSALALDTSTVPFPRAGKKRRRALRSHGSIRASRAAPSPGRRRHDCRDDLAGETCAWRDRKRAPPRPASAGAEARGRCLRARAIGSSFRWVGTLANRSLFALAERDPTGCSGRRRGRASGPDGVRRTAQS
jgi:hypothetical protein